MTARVTGSTRPSGDLDQERRKLLFRSWHRGMREMDLILGAFADSQIGRLDADELERYADLLETPDGDLLDWLTGRRPLPPRDEAPMLHRIIDFGRDGPA